MKGINLGIGLDRGKLNRKGQQTSIKYLVHCLLLFLFVNSYVYSREQESGNGFIPVTPPIALYTGHENLNYWEAGYLRFNLLSPLNATPKFTLGNDEDATFHVGDVEYATKNIIFTFSGNIGQEKSSEKALLAGTLSAKMKNSTFTRLETDFNIETDQEGYVLGGRLSNASRLYKSNLLTLDWALSTIIAYYHFSGRTRFSSETISGETWQYISDYDIESSGLALRPMLILQPQFHFHRNLTVVPFAGFSMFMNVASVSTEVNEWEDVLYGPDCFDGCPKTRFNAGSSDLESFFGFDVKLHFDNHTILLSSFVTSTTDKIFNADTMSEIYVTYTQEYY